jgi:hypothetical protein
MWNVFVVRASFDHEDAEVRRSFGETSSDHATCGTTWRDE